MLRATIADDGVGGAVPGGGSGLIGLKDRVEAVGGRTILESPPGRGTMISIELPIAPPEPLPSPDDVARAHPSPPDRDPR
jgi:signal transduction histidine kinase